MTARVNTGFKTGAAGPTANLCIRGQKMSIVGLEETAEISRVVSTNMINQVRMDPPLF